MASAVDAFVVPLTMRGRLPNVALVWESRQSQDAYSRRSRAEVEALDPEIDHVFEVQLIDAAFDAYARHPTVGRVLRSEHAQFRAIANCLANANVTTRDINRSKKGPFKRAKNDWVAADYDDGRCPGVDAYVYRAPGRRWPDRYGGMSDADWANIKREVVASYDELAARVDDVADIAAAKRETFSDYLQGVFLSLHID